MQCDFCSYNGIDTEIFQPLDTKPIEYAVCKMCQIGFTILGIRRTQFANGEPMKMRQQLKESDAKCLLSE